MAKIRKILIANRGEIAIRIIRSCREMNIKTVALYSDADRLSPHVLMADEAYHIGASRASESYLNINKIIDNAKLSGADAVHPGYGFLAENADFASRVQKANLIFIGPNPASIRLMGNKTESRKTMTAAGIPVVPGSQIAVKSERHARTLIKTMGGYPVLIKAAAGGGGKGMRIVRSAAELKRALKASQNEAEKSFGDPTIYIEKYLEFAKHIEIQIFADSHGNYLHLHERDCSVQRRHQKVIEESPSPVLTDKKRAEMGEVATEVARACNYLGAGTVEFLYERDGNFYFLEMNTRLQVEHPVTEMLLGLDLVKLQILVAEGKAIPFARDEIKPRGHAIECRIYAEDAQNNFLPSTGKITYLHQPDGPGVRVDSGVNPNSEITLFYDPLIGKLITWAENREACISRMKRALWEYKISGVSTTIPFCARVLEHPAFLDGSYDTHFVDNYLDEIKELEAGDEETAKIAALAVAFTRMKRKSAPAMSDGLHFEKCPVSPWKARRTKV